jgi:hypothetical protein
MPRAGGIGQISVKISSGSGIGKVRDARGRYIARDVKALRAEYMDMAFRVQANVLSHMSTSYARPSVVTGRLERVTADRRNRVYGDQGFGVGVERFLDRSVAKYWRTIEEGSAKVWGESGKSMIGMEIRGKFGGAFVGWRESSWGVRPVAGAPWRAYPGFFAPLRKLPPMVIKKEIAPMHAYLRAYQEGGIFDREAPRAVREFVWQVARATLVGE